MNSADSCGTGGRVVDPVSIADDYSSILQNHDSEFVGFHFSYAPFGCLYCFLILFNSPNWRLNVAFEGLMVI